MLTRTPPHPTQSPAKKCSLHGSLGQALMEEGTGKPRGFIPILFSLIPVGQPLGSPWKQHFLSSAGPIAFPEVLMPPLAPTFLRVAAGLPLASPWLLTSLLFFKDS